MPAVGIDDVALWAKLGNPAGTAPAGPEGDLLAAVIDAVHEHIVDRYDVPADPEEFNAVQRLAVMIQSARLWRRRDMTHGVGEFGDMAPLRVDRLDGDVAALLTPKYGFA